jgi:anti-sigma regulatory factor (Ser/Thr protein kinase)
MWLRIVDIDFDTSRVHLEVAPEESEEFFTRLDAFVSRCAAEDLDDVRLHHRRGTSKRNVTRLEDFCAMKNLRPPTAQLPRISDAGACVRFRSEPKRSRKVSNKQGHRIRYRVGIDRIDRAVERLNKAIALIADSEDLNPRSKLLLRLCVYELATNTIEHGTFSNAPPEICLELTFAECEVSVIYRDNADVFLTDSPASINMVEEQISTSSKRGLGLYMLNKLCPDFEYERVNDWNTSSFSLETKKEREFATKR